MKTELNTLSKINKNKRYEILKNANYYISIHHLIIQKFMEKQKQELKKLSKQHFDCILTTSDEEIIKLTIETKQKARQIKELIEYREKIYKQKIIELETEQTTRLVKLQNEYTKERENYKKIIIELKKQALDKLTIEEKLELKEENKKKTARKLKLKKDKCNPVDTTENCAICLENLDVNSIPLCSDNRHSLHVNCGVQLLQLTGKKSKCPICLEKITNKKFNVFTAK